MVEGAILNGASWRWIFVINVPLVLVCLWLIRKAVPASPPATARRKVDVVGALLGVLGLGGSGFPPIEQARLLRFDPPVSGSFLSGAHPLLTLPRHGHPPRPPTI